ncbi:MAG: hypothetical protein H6741_29930 [Alphaproteobacteria bacterium]|nr:hypothetical protein [Alphaproteobacteria bacterium]MCB9796923.1 hypothetical protein [Alphaproteobacteria bacterium]
MTLLLALAACTFSPGAEGFTTIEEASLSGRLDVEDASWVTDLGAVVTLETATLSLGDLSMQALSGGAVDFDPANPPEGYTLCHGGHCHTTDGDLVDYVDIIQELSGGQASFEEVAAFEGEHVLDLLSDEALPLSTSTPHLPITEITRVEGAWLEPGLLLEGTVGDGDESVPLTITLTPEVALAGGLSLPVDRAQAARVAVDLSVELPATLLDGVDLLALAGEDGVWLDDPEDPALIAITEKLLATELAGDADPLE